MLIEKVYKTMYGKVKRMPGYLELILILGQVPTKNGVMMEFTRHNETLGSARLY